jgi:molybdopterin synthase sulfur carrier subunit
MPIVHFTANLTRHVSCPSVHVEGATVGEVLEAVFQQNPRLRSYVVDEQGALRKHMNVFVDGQQIRDRERHYSSWGEPVGASSELYVMQALSGG